MMIPESCALPPHTADGDMRGANEKCLTDEAWYDTLGSLVLVALSWEIRAMFWYPGMFAPVFLILVAVLLIAPPTSRERQYNYRVKRVIGIVLALGAFGFLVYDQIDILVSGYVGESPLDAFAAPVLLGGYLLIIYRLVLAVRARRHNQSDTPSTGTDV
jgi:hypothetical protein